MATKAPEYVERYRQIDELLELMRGSDPAGPVGPTDIQNFGENDLPPGFDGPAHRQTADLPGAYRKNLQLIAAADPHNLGRNIDTGKTIPRVFESPGDNLPSHHQSSGGVQARQPRGTLRRPQASSTAQIGIPGYIAHGVPGSHMETASKAIEELRKQALWPPTRATTAPGPAPGKSPAAPDEQQYFDATESQPASGQVPETTNPNFAYLPGKSGYDEWLALHTGGAKVRSGEGKPVSDAAYGVTVTQHAPKKTTT